jgi:enoyl-[acyl-carrier protein] reductase III
MIDLRGRIALVTGASRGIGRACAIRLAEAGADVIVNFLTSRTAAEKVATEIGGLGRRAAVVKADVSEPEDVAAVFEFIVREFGKLDILVSNAAAGGFRPLLSAGPAQFEAAMNTNVRALLSLVQCGLPLMKNAAGRSKVIAISSHGSRLAIPDYGLIGASKAAMESMMRQFALEAGKDGVNFNIVLAGLVPTAAVQGMPGYSQLAERARKRSLAGERNLEAADIADAVLFLASPLSDSIQGQTLVVDAGVSIH